VLEKYDIVWLMEGIKIGVAGELDLNAVKSNGVITR
jgi:hypothetical protein